MNRDLRNDVHCARFRNQAQAVFKEEVKKIGFQKLTYKMKLMIMI